MVVPTARPGDGFVYVYRSKVSHPSENTTLAPGNNARHPRARRKYDTAAIGDETNGHSERPTARTRARWMDGRTRRARATRDERQSDTRRRSRGSYIFFLLSPSSRRRERGRTSFDTGVTRGSIPSIQYRAPRARFPRRRLEVTERGANARATTTTTMMMMTAPTETAPMPISSRARSVSEDGDDDDVAAKRRHSFSTDCSARTIAVDGARLHDDRSSPIPDDDATREDARRCVNGEEKISLDALRALAEANADVARPDGFELHADVCATLLASERARGRDAVVTVDVGRAHHAPYRGELVEWILDVCAGERYGPTTADVAIAYTVRPETRARSIAARAAATDRTGPVGRRNCHREEGGFVLLGARRCGGCFARIPKR